MNPTLITKLHIFEDIDIQLYLFHDFCVVSLDHIWSTVRWIIRGKHLVDRRHSPACHSWLAVSCIKSHWTADFYFFFQKSEKCHSNSLIPFFHHLTTFTDKYHNWNAFSGAHDFSAFKTKCIQLNLQLIFISMKLIPCSFPHT